MQYIWLKTISTYYNSKSKINYSLAILKKKKNISLDDIN